jgi:hypothetical protein
VLAHERGDEIAQVGQDRNFVMKYANEWRMERRIYNHRTAVAMKWNILLLHVMFFVREPFARMVRKFVETHKLNLESHPDIAPIAFVSEVESMGKPDEVFLQVIFKVRINISSSAARNSR